MPSATRRLHARVPIWDDEPAWALLSRLARRNGIPTISRMEIDYGIRVGDTAKGWATEKVAVLAGADPAKLAASTFRKFCDFMELNDEVIHADDWSPSATVKVCPSCLKADLGRADSRVEFLPHVRTWWNLRFMHVCPSHHNKLVVRKAASTSEADIRRRRVTDVRFSVDPDADMLQHPTGDIVEDVRVYAYLLGRLRFMPRVPNELLDQVPLLNVVRVLERLGGAWLKRSSTESAKAKDPHERLTTGFTAFAEGKSSLHAFLDGFVETANVRNGSWSAGGVYGSFYQWLEYRALDKGYDSIRELVGEHIVRSVPLGPNETIFGRKVQRRRLFTLFHAAKELGTSPEAATRLFRALGHLDGIDENKPYWQIVLTENLVREVVHALSDRMNYKAATRYLGLSNGAMEGLYGHGLVRPFIVANEGGEHVFRKRDLDEFCESILGDAPFVDHVPEGLYDIVTAGRVSQTSTSEVVDLLMKDQLTCQARQIGRIGLMQALVDPMIIRTIHYLHFAPDHHVTLGQASKQLRVKPEVLAKMIERGIILCSQGQPLYRNIPQSYVCTRSLDEFIGKFVGAAAVAKALGTQVNAAIAACVRKGISPSFSTNDIGSVFFERDRLPFLDANGQIARGLPPEFFHDFLPKGKRSLAKRRTA